jgi:hypothetical protein
MKRQNILPKTDCRSVLKNLPIDIQEQIAGWIETPKGPGCRGGLLFAKEQLLAVHSIKIGHSTLGIFHQWWRSHPRPVAKPPLPQAGDCSIQIGDTTLRISSPSGQPIHLVIERHSGRN